MLRIPLDAGASAKLTTLSPACERRDMESLRMLLSAGADPNRINRLTSSPLQVALQQFTPIGIINGEDPKAPQTTSAEVVALLLKSGADVNIRSCDNDSTALHIAALHSNTSMIRTLLAAGAKLDAISRDSLTPLHYAINAATECGNFWPQTESNRGFENFQMLVAAGACLGPVGDERISALHVAALFENHRIIERLLEGGVHIHAVDAQGRSALIWATLSKVRFANWRRTVKIIFREFRKRSPAPATWPVDMETLLHIQISMEINEFKS